MNIYLQEYLGRTRAVKFPAVTCSPLSLSGSVITPSTKRRDPPLILVRVRTSTFEMSGARCIGFEKENRLVPLTGRLEEADNRVYV